MKKILAVILCVILIISTLLTASATDVPAYVNGNVNAEPGMEITVPVSIKGNIGIISLRLQIIYDEDILELVSVENKGILNGFTEPAGNKSSPYILRWADSLTKIDNTAQGDVAILTFKVSKDAGDISSDIEIRHIESFNFKLNEIFFEDAVQTVTVSTEHIYTNYVSDKNATCTDDGTKTAVCDVCKKAKETITDTGSALGHSLDETVKEPDCLNKGQSKAECSRCDFYEIKEISPKGHSDKDSNNYCDVCSAVIDASKVPTTTIPKVPVLEIAVEIDPVEESDVPVIKKEPSETKVKKPAKVKIKKPESTKKKQVVVTWKAVMGAKGYQVAYSTNRKFKKKLTKTKLIKKAKTTKTTLKKLQSGKKYFIKVRAYKTVKGKKIYGVYSKVMSVKVK